MLTYNGKKLFRERESMSKSLCIVINEMAIWLFLLSNRKIQIT